LPRWFSNRGLFFGGSLTAVAVGELTFGAGINPNIGLPLLRPYWRNTLIEPGIFGLFSMIRYSLQRLIKSRATLLSNRNGSLEKAYRELEDLRERVKKAELVAVKSRGQSTSPRR
jgi:hypothetical protein